MFHLLKYSALFVIYSLLQIESGLTYSQPKITDTLRPLKPLEKIATDGAEVLVDTEKVIENVEPVATTVIKTVNVEPVTTIHKKVNVRLPFDLLISNTQECPHLQDMGAKLLLDKDYCDIDIEVTDPITKRPQTFCAHKSILGMRSSFFAERIKALVASQVGGGRLLLKLEGLEPRIFRLILNYIYTDKLSPEFSLKDHIMDLYIEAQILNITDLLKITEDHLYSSITINDAASYLKWAHIHKINKIKTFILDLTRNTLQMNKTEWELFLKNLCEAYGYTLSGGAATAEILGNAQLINGK